MTARLMKAWPVVVCFSLALLATHGGTKTLQEQSENVSKQSSRLTKQEGANMLARVIKSDKEWRKVLTPEQYRITRKKGKERAFS